MRDSAPIVPFRIVEENKLDLTDLKILESLIDQKSIRDTSDDLKISEKTVSNRVNAMIENKIILKKEVPVVDILRLYNFIYLTYIKIKLSAAIPETATKIPRTGLVPINYTPPPPSWVDALGALKEDPLFSKIVRFSFAVISTEWDLVLMISTQSIKEYTKFFTQLQQKGFIEKVSGQQVLHEGYFFNPISVPDAAEFVAGFEQMNTYVKENKEKEKEPNL